MGPEKRKGELPADEAAEADRAARRDERSGGAGRRATGSTTPIEEREEEGYDQPQSSAQKAPQRPEDESLGE